MVQLVLSGQWSIVTGTILLWERCLSCLLQPHHYKWLLFRSHGLQRSGVLPAVLVSAVSDLFRLGGTEITTVTGSCQPDVQPIQTDAGKNHAVRQASLLPS